MCVWWDDDWSVIISYTSSMKTCFDTVFNFSEASIVAFYIAAHRWLYSWRDYKTKWKFILASREITGGRNSQRNIDIEEYTLVKSPCSPVASCETNLDLFQPNEPMNRRGNTYYIWYDLGASLISDSNIERHNRIISDSASSFSTTTFMYTFPVRILPGKTFSSEWSSCITNEEDDPPMRFKF